MIEKINPACPVPNCTFSNTGNCPMYEAMEKMNNLGWVTTGSTKDFINSGLGNSCVKKDDLSKFLKKLVQAKKRKTQEISRIELDLEANKTPYFDY